MAKHKQKIYLAFFAFAAAWLIFTCLCPSLSIIHNLRADTQFNLDEYGIFMNVMAENSNYISLNNITVIFPLGFMFGLNLVYSSYKPYLLLRYKSRMQYTLRHMLDALIFSSVFVLLMEFINICYSFAVFGAQITLESRLILYSFLDFWTMMLYFMRAGILLFIMRVIVNEKLAPLIIFPIYLLEFWFVNFLELLPGLWMPCLDSISVNYLLAGAMLPTDVLWAVIRGVLMNGALIIIAYFIFQKKDIIGYEKK